jgi:hypothetical protein
VQHRYAVLGFFGVLSACYFAFVVWALVTVPSSPNTLYVYDSAAGYLVCALMALCAAWFAVYAARSYSAEVSAATPLWLLWRVLTFECVLVLGCRTSRRRPLCSCVWVCCL